MNLAASRYWCSVGWHDPSRSAVLKRASATRKTKSYCDSKSSWRRATGTDAYPPTPSPVLAQPASTQPARSTMVLICCTVVQQQGGEVAPFVPRGHERPGWAGAKDRRRAGASTSSISTGCVNSATSYASARSTDCVNSATFLRKCQY
eukprot:1081492-Rhodomonas_salina.3